MDDLTYELVEERTKALELIIRQWAERDNITVCKHWFDEPMEVCPYRQDIHNDDSAFCLCCDGCRRECSQDV